MFAFLAERGLIVDTGDLIPWSFTGNLLLQNIGPQLRSLREKTEEKQEAVASALLFWLDNQFKTPDAHRLSRVERGVREVWPQELI